LTEYIISSFYLYILASCWIQKKLNIMDSSARVYNRVSEEDRVEIVSLREQGWTFQAIADKLHLNIRTVHAVWMKWKEMHVVADLSKLGRPPKLDDRSKRLLVRMMQKGEVETCPEFVQVAATHHDIHISPSTARRLLHEAGMKARHTIRKPRLTVEHKRERLEFAQAHQHWKAEDWKQVIFSDETVITAIPLHSHKLKWIDTTEPLDPALIIPTVQGGGAKIMTWGCISTFGFHNFVLLEDRVNAEAYINTLSTDLLPIIQQYFHYQPCIFQQDGASIHTAQAVQQFFQDNNLQVLDWPPHSPDLNIIEHVWHYLKEELYKLPEAHNKDELWNNVESVIQIMWSPEMTNKINNLYDSLPNRMAAVIDANGGHTKY
jgi:transposase